MADVVDIQEKQWALFVCPSCGLHNYARAEPQHRSPCGKCGTSLEKAQQISGITTTRPRPASDSPAAPVILAGIGDRFGARLIDSAFYVVLIVLFLMLDSVLFFIAYFGLIIVNEIVLVVTSGQQVGKRIVGIEIVNESSRKHPSVGEAIVRYIVSDFFLSAFWALWDKRRQALHDKAAGTLVVKRT